MIAQIFSLIQLILKAFQLWDAFVDHVDQRDIVKRQERKDAREKALAELQNAQSEDEFDRLQDAIVDNAPKP